MIVPFQMTSGSMPAHFRWLTIWTTTDLINFDNVNMDSRRPVTSPSILCWENTVTPLTSRASMTSS
jgi:hypothetical protein